MNFAVVYLQVKALININHELRTPLTLIYAPLKQLADNKLIPYELRTKLYGVLKHTRQMRRVRVPPNSWPSTLSTVRENRVSVIS